MAKPWARIQQNYINHQKFLVLSPTAICLWLEGKNYCDMQHTDGLIPRAALKTFRFATRQAVDALCQSAGQKADGSPWAPLWEAAGTVGFKMHDYLDYNDCRDAVIARIEQADDERDRKKKNQKDYRDRKKQERYRSRGDNDHGHANRAVTAQIETDTETATPVVPPIAEPVTPRGARSWDAEAFMDAFRSHWKRLYGYECSLLLKPLEFTSLQQQLAAIPEARLLAALGAFFDTTEDYVRKAKHPLGLFLRDPLRFLALPVVPAASADTGVDRVRELLKESL